MSGEREPYPAWAKMPNDYDFSTFGKDWSAYKSFYRLRTDAVWEKWKLYQYFRSFYKKMFFDLRDSKYYYVQPLTRGEAMDSGLFEESLIPYEGITPSGGTNAFEVAAGARRPPEVSSQTNFLHQDYYELCTLRFEHYNRCDMAYHKKKLEIAQQGKEYPCLSLFYDAQYACSDETLLYLMETNYYRKLNKISPHRFHNHELLQRPTAWDTIDPGAIVNPTY